MNKGTCGVCKGAVPEKAAKCPRCGVALGNPIDRAIDEMKKYDEGVEPHSYRDYDE